MNRIEHLIIVMMENRSFDHYLGSLSLPEEGRTDIEGLSFPLPTNPDSMGKQVEAWNMDGTFCGYDDPPHKWADQHTCYDKGLNNGFVENYELRTNVAHATNANLPMGYYTRKTLPVLYALADEFTVCDHWFASLLSSTWPNRKYFYSGRRDEDRDTEVIPAFPGFRTTPFLDVLEDARDPETKHRLSWKCYYSDVPFLGLWYKFAATHSSKLTSIANFVEDCREDRLPTISIIDPPFSLANDHPSNDVRLGQKFLGLIVDALTHSESWEKSAMVILYDENGGFFDHVAPPDAFDDGTPVAQDGDSPLGYRVPALVVSPYARKRHACKTVFDHTSILKSISLRWEIAWDRNLFGDRWYAAPDIWSHCFDFNEPPLPVGTYTHAVDEIQPHTLPPYSSMNWAEGIHTRLSHPIGEMQALLERIFVLPGLKTLDQRAKVYDMLHGLEQDVITLKRMHRP